MQITKSNVSFRNAANTAIKASVPQNQTETKLPPNSQQAKIDSPQPLPVIKKSNTDLVDMAWGATGVLAGALFCLVPAVRNIVAVTISGVAALIASKSIRHKKPE